MINELNLETILLSFDMLVFVGHIDTYHFPIRTGMVNVIRMVNHNPKNTSTEAYVECWRYELKMQEKERNRDKCHVHAFYVIYSKGGVGWRTALPCVSYS